MAGQKARSAVFAGLKTRPFTSYLLHRRQDMDARDERGHDRGAWPLVCYFSQIFSGTDAVGQFIVPE